MMELDQRNLSTRSRGLSDVLCIRIFSWKWKCALDALLFAIVPGVLRALRGEGYSAFGNPTLDF
jgi:hypothetical protein